MTSVYDFTAQDISGKVVPLERYRDKVLLVVIGALLQLPVGIYVLREPSAGPYIVPPWMAYLRAVATRCRTRSRSFTKTTLYWRGPRVPYGLDQLGGEKKRQTK